MYILQYLVALVALIALARVLGRRNVKRVSAFNTLNK